MQRFAIFVKKSLKINISKIKKCCKVRDHCHYTGEYRRAAHSICNLKYKIVLHNQANYDHHFIIKELAEEFEGKFN